MKEHQTKQLQANLSTKFFCNCDPETAQFASSHCDTERESFASYSSGRGEEEATSSLSESYQPVLKISELFRLRTGGPGNGYVVDSIVVRGRPFAPENLPFLRVSFSQK
ncbi:MAG: hypothetical protein U0835_00585 [Isosphaeraceae bacterium]